MSGTRQWIRNCSVVVADASGRGIEFGALHIVFRVTHEVAGETPKTLVLRAFNVAPDTAKILQSKEFTRVILKVGYGNPATERPQLATLFEGSIKQARRGRMNATDTYVDILAGSSDAGYNWAKINTAIAAGYTQKDVNDLVTKAFASYDIKAGAATGFQEGKAPRGRVLWGVARDVARELAYTNQMTWSLADGVYDQVPVAEALPGEAIVINSATGMVGMPQITNDGIVVRTLLNPAIKGNRLVKLDNKSIQEFVLGPGWFSEASFRPEAQADGTYKVIFCDHVGDTRGQEWYSEFVCHSIDQSAAPTPAVTKAVGYNP